MKKILYTITIILVLAVGYIISPIDNLPSEVKLSKTIYTLKHSLFGEDEEFKDEEYKFSTYRLLHQEMWYELGIEPKDFEEVMAKMERSKKQRKVPKLIDTVIKYGDANWEYEFEVLGDKYFKEAVFVEQNTTDKKKLKNAFLKASMYYMLAASPGVVKEWYPNYNHVLRAYDKAMVAYNRAGEYFDATVEKISVDIDGKKAEGFLHLPKTIEAKVPAVIMTNGSDFFQVKLFPFVDKFLAQGIAVLTFDLPGLGASYEISLSPDSKLHSKFIDYLQSDTRIDSQRIGAVGKSFGGNMAVRLAFDKKEKKRLKAVVNYCGPIEQAFNVPLDVLYEEVPPMALDALFSRFDIDKQNSELREVILKNFGLVSAGNIKEGDKTNVPIFSINNSNDPVNPVWEMKLLTHLSDGEMSVKNGNGHCPPKEAPQEVVDWVKKTLN